MTDSSCLCEQKQLIAQSSAECLCRKPHRRTGVRHHFMAAASCLTEEKLVVPWLKAPYSCICFVLQLLLCLWIFWTRKMTNNKKWKTTILSFEVLSGHQDSTRDEFAAISKQDQEPSCCFSSEWAKYVGKDVWIDSGGFPAACVTTRLWSNESLGSWTGRKPQCFPWKMMDFFLSLVGSRLYGIVDAQATQSFFLEVRGNFFQQDYWKSWETPKQDSPFCFTLWDKQSINLFALEGKRHPFFLNKKEHTANRVCTGCIFVVARLRLSEQQGWVRISVLIQRHHPYFPSPRCAQLFTTQLTLVHSEAWGTSLLSSREYVILSLRDGVFANWEWIPRDLPRHCPQSPENRAASCFNKHCFTYNLSCFLTLLCSCLQQACNFVAPGNLYYKLLIAA